MASRIREAVGSGTQDEAAARIGVSQATISRYRRLRDLPEPIMLLVRLTAHGVDGHWLLGGDAGGGVAGRGSWRADYLRGRQDVLRELSERGLDDPAALREHLLAEEAGVREQLARLRPGRASPPRGTPRRRDAEGA